MTNLADAIKEYIEGNNSDVSGSDIRKFIQTNYEDRWKDSTVSAYLYGCVVNNPKSYIHHPSLKKFLYKNNDGTFCIYSEESHGENEWVPVEGDDETAEIVELVETTVSLERDIENHLIKNLDSLEPGLKYVSRQYCVDVGRVDILAEDKNGVMVIIEIKIGEAKDSAIGQIARYLGWFAQNGAIQPRGMLVAGDFSDGVRYGANAVKNLTLHSYKVNFSFVNETL